MNISRDYKYQFLDRNKATKKWEKPLKELVESNFDITMEIENPNIKRKLAWMGALGESASSRDNRRSLLLESGYGSINPQNLSGMGAIRNTNITNTGNTRTTNNADKGSGDYQKNLTMTSMHIAASTIAFELLPVIPVEVPIVTMTFVESVYGGTRVSDETKSPQYIEIPLKFFKALDANTTDFQTAGNSFAQGENVKLVKNSVYFIVGNGSTANELVANKGVQLRYVGQHHITADYQFQVLENIEVTGAATGVYTTVPTEYISTFLNEVATIGANGYALTYETAPNVLAFADAQTVLLGSSTTNADVISVDLVDTKQSPIYGAGNSDGFTESPMPREVSELGTENAITIRTWSTSAKVSDRDILCAVTNKQERDLRPMGFDAFEIALEAAKTQLMQEINNHILDTMFKLGVSNHVQVYEGTGISLHLYVDDPLVAGASIANMAISDTNTFKLETLDGTDVSADFGVIPNFRENNNADGQLDIVRMVKGRVGLASSLIGKLNRTTKADFVVCGTGLQSALVDSRNYTSSPHDQTLMSGSDVLTYFGQVEGMDMYVDPRMDLTDNRILVGRRGEEMDSGLKCFIYDLLSDVQTIEGQSMSKKALVSTSYLLLAAGHHPEINYLTFIAETATGLWS